MPEVQLNGPRVINGAVRYPVEGLIPVSDTEYDRLVEADAIVTEDDEDGDGLDEMTLPDLGLLVTKEGVPLNGATKKADIIKAIRAHRAPAA
jgi:hypothetical protein